MSEGLRLVAAQPYLLASAGSAGTYTLFSSVMGAVYLLYLTRQLHVPPALLGLLLGAVGPGSLLGALLASRMAKRFGLGPMLVGGMALVGVANLGVPLAGGAPALAFVVLALSAFLNGFGQPFYNVNQVSLRQAITPALFRGRVNATMQFIAGSAAPLGAVLGGALGQTLGLRATLLVGAFGTLLAVPWLVGARLLLLREPPPSPVSEPA